MRLHPCFCLCVLPLLAGCAETSAPVPSHGGQSGTDGDSSGACSGPREYGLAQHIRALEFSPNDLLEFVGGAHLVYGAWFSTQTATGLHIELDGIESARMVSDNCGPAELGVSAHLWTDDGAIDAVASELDIALQSPAVLEVALPDLPAAYRGEAAADAVPLLTVSFALGYGDPSNALEAEVAANGLSLGKWSTNPQRIGLPVPSAYVPPAAFANRCGDLTGYADYQPGDFSPLSDAVDAKARVTGTWLLCESPLLTTWVGVDIRADGSVRDLVVEGERVVARAGFGHESQLAVFDTSAMNESPGQFQISANHFGGYVWKDALVGSDEQGRTLLRSTNTSFPEAENSYAVFDRAGAAGCQAAEDELAELPELSDGDGVPALAAGSWTLCSGSLPTGAGRLVLDAAGRVSHFGPSGALIDTSVCTSNALMGPASMFQLTCLDSHYGWPSWTFTVATRPMKLLVGNGGRRAVFSALPN